MYSNYDEVLANTEFQEDLAKGESWSIEKWARATINWDLGNIAFIKLHKGKSQAERQQLIRDGFDLFGKSDDGWGFFMMMVLSLSDEAFDRMMQVLD